MKISLVLTTFNGEKFIKKQLTSLLNQSQSLDEVFILDDHSSDSTSSIVNDFIEMHQLKHWKCIINSKNIGYRGNFYQGLEMITGDIVFLCDQDDVWCQDKVEKMSSILENPRIGLLASSFNLIDENDRLIIVNDAAKKSNHNLLDLYVAKNDVEEVPLSHVIRKNFSQGCCMAIKKEFVDDYLACSKKLLPHDWELALIASSHDACYFLNKELIKYRIHANNAIGLQNVIENKKGQSSTYRVKNRIRVIEEEQEAVKFLLSYKGLLNSYKKEIEKRNACFEFRKECIERKKICKLFFSCIFGRYRNFCNIRMIGGDIISILK